MKFLCDHMYCDLTPEECPCWCHRPHPGKYKPKVNWEAEAWRWWPYFLLLVVQAGLWMLLPTEPGYEFFRVLANGLVLGAVLATCQLRKDIP